MRFLFSKICGTFDKYSRWPSVLFMYDVMHRSRFNCHLCGSEVMISEIWCNLGAILKNFEKIQDGRPDWSRV